MNTKGGNLFGAVTSIKSIQGENSFLLAGGEGESHCAGRLFAARLGLRRRLRLPGKAMLTDDDLADAIEEEADLNGDRDGKIRNRLKK